MKKYIFDDDDSVIHFMVGLILSLSLVLSPGLIVLVLLVDMAFAFYEVHEKENPVSTIGDFMEYAFGRVVGLTITIGCFLAQLKLGW